MPQIIPALLCQSPKELREQIKATENFFPHVQIDIGDGVFVPFKTPFGVDDLAGIRTSQRYELHLMVADPIVEIQKWESIPNIFRTIFHLESSLNPSTVIAAVRDIGWEVGIALNPDTPLTLVRPFYDLVDVVLFMTVAPGKQGQAFIPEVGEKISKFGALSERPKCAVDGGINKDNIAQVAKWGGELLCVGSALMKSGKTVEEAYKELQEKLIGMTQ